MGLKWSRVKAGHWCARRWNPTLAAFDQIHAAIYTTGRGKPDWQVRINGAHRGYSGTLAGCKRIVAIIYGED